MAACACRGFCCEGRFNLLAAVSDTDLRITIDADAILNIGFDTSATAGVSNSSVSRPAAAST
jgi:hypothetical protein